MTKYRVDIETGRRLRKLGWSHADIAKYLGCSEGWCRHNLNDTSKDFEQMKACAELYFQSNQKELEV